MQPVSCWCSALTALIGNRDESGEPVTAGEWAQSTCGKCGVWRGQMDASIEDIRTPSGTSTAGGEGGGRHRRGAPGWCGRGSSAPLQATETLVDGVDNAGIPDTSRKR